MNIIYQCIGLYLKAANNWDIFFQVKYEANISVAKDQCSIQNNWVWG